MSIEPQPSQPSFSGRVFEQHEAKARFGDRETALVRARVLLAVVVVAAALAPVIEALRWLGELAVPSDPDTPAQPWPWPLLMVAIAVFVRLLYRRRGGDSTRGLVGMALAVGAAVDLCATSVIVADQTLFRGLPVPSVLVIDYGVPVAAVWVVIAGVVAWRSDKHALGPLVVMVLSLALITAAALAVVLPAFTFGGSIN